MYINRIYRGEETDEGMIFLVLLHTKLTITITLKYFWGFEYGALMMKTL